MNLLIIEASTERGVVAFSRGDTIVRSEELPYGNQSSRHLLPATERILAGEKPDAIVVGVGPGSYTGIRIGAITAKTLSYIWSVPIYPVSTLEAFTPDRDEPFAVVIDAKVSGAYVWKGVGEPKVVTLDDLGKELEGIVQLVTPKQEPLRQKVAKLYPENRWEWQEKAPNPAKMVSFAKSREPVTHVELQLNYLRKPYVQPKSELGSA